MKLKELGLGLAIIVALTLGVFFISKPLNVRVEIPKFEVPLGSGGSPIKTESQSFLAGFRIGNETYNNLNRYNCGTLSYTIPALSGRNSSVGAAHTTTTVNLTGASLGDQAWVSNNSSTNALRREGVIATAEISSVTGTNASATVMFFNVTTVTSTAITTSTVEVCYSG